MQKCVHFCICGCTDTIVLKVQTKQNKAARHLLKIGVQISLDSFCGEIICAMNSSFPLAQNYFPFNSQIDDEKL